MKIRHLDLIRESYLMKEWHFGYLIRNSVKKYVMSLFYISLGLTNYVRKNITILRIKIFLLNRFPILRRNKWTVIHIKIALKCFVKFLFYNQIAILFPTMQHPYLQRCQIRQWTFVLRSAWRNGHVFTRPQCISQWVG